jgi:hypothetical protein
VESGTVIKIERPVGNQVTNVSKSISCRTLLKAGHLAVLNGHWKLHVPNQSATCLLSPLVKTGYLQMLPSRPISVHSANQHRSKESDLDVILGALIAPRSYAL